MTKTGARRFLLILFLVYFGAVFLRIDYFPLSWVPMYGQRHNNSTIHVMVGDKTARSKDGFRAQRANGEMLNIKRRDLNIPDVNYRRLFNQRAFNRGPPHHRRERVNLMPFNKWWYETLIGPDPLLTHNYAKELLVSVNATLGYGASDPARIVRLETPLKVFTYTREQLAAGDIANPKSEKVVAVITPDQVTAVYGDGREVKDLNNDDFIE